MAGSTNLVASLNFNLDEIRAAIGRSQLGRLSDRILGRQRVVAELQGS